MDEPMEAGFMLYTIHMLTRGDDKCRWVIERQK
jgi:hypothetical protein